MKNTSNGLVRVSLGIFNDAIQRFIDARAAEAAASIAFYAIFSLFPLLLALIVAGSFVLESERVQQGVLDIVAQAIPVSQQLIEKNIRSILERRGTVGFVALGSLLWSGTSFLVILIHSINRAWPEAEPHNLLKSRWIALKMIGCLIVPLLLSSLLTTVLEILSQFRLPLLGELSICETPLWTILSSAVPRLITFFALLGLYWQAPSVQVKWSEAFLGALVAALAWEVATKGFTWYLSSGIFQYELVYGSLGTILLLMLWIYIGVLIILFGAHLCAAIARRAE
jgi:membrane protein